MRSRVLRISFPGSTARPIPLRARRIRLGGGAGNEVQLRGPGVQPVHALLLGDGETFEVFDLSGDGIALNGRRVNHATLQPGDVLGIAGHLLKLEECASHDLEASHDGEPTRLFSAPPALVHSASLLLCTRARSGWRSYPLKARHTFLGKSADNDIVLEDSSVSRFHCRLTADGPSLELEDLCSTNGTFLNGTRVLRGSVGSGAELRLGRVILQVAAADSAASGREESFAGLVGASAAMRDVCRSITRFACDPDPVLVFGETGTGKELVARALHGQGLRRDQPFVALNCGALPRELVESELFGHERGAFSGAVGQRRGLFEEADGGVLFLDEVAELTPEAQSTLLRALESGEVRRVGSNHVRRVNARIVAACNRPLADLVRAGRFRRDLYHRLCVIEIRLPPLRDRLGDLPALAAHFLSPQNGGLGKALSPAAMELLHRHTWPGNVRELRNVLRRASLCADGTVIGAEHLPLATEDPRPLVSAEARPLADIERQAIELALQRNHGNKAAAARELGISRSTLFEKVRRLQIPTGGEVPLPV
jgi:DNA-binding NtrC family response regulator